MKIRGQVAGRFFSLALPALLALAALFVLRAQGPVEVRPKPQPPEVASKAAKLGLSVFGESKVQEAKAKIPLCPGRLRWHLIGHLQSNKCRDAVELFHAVLIAMSGLSIKRHP